MYASFNKDPLKTEGKRQAFKAWKTGKGTRASYHAAKRIARRAVHHARQEADKVYNIIDPVFRIIPPCKPI